MTVEVAKCLVLSTAHLPSASPDWGGYRVVEHEYGYVVWLAITAGLECPEWLVPIVQLALDREGATMLDFDRDGPELDELPSHDW